MNIEVPGRVLVVGSGSIAARHVRNLLALGAREVILQTRRDVSSVPGFKDERITVTRDLPDDCPKFAIVANDTDRHVSAALELVKRDAHVLIEKPIAPAADDDLRQLAAEVQERGLVVRVAYNLRFLPVFREVERALREGVIGRVLFVRLEAGQHLGAWRPDRPYVLGYSASPARGGGVALDLSHELDYMRMLFGHPTVSCVHHAHSGSLGIESADIFDAIYEFPHGLVCSVHLDYLESALRRRLRIVGTDGVIECDLAAHRLSVDGGAVTQTFVDEHLFDTAQTYVDEVVNFLSETFGCTPSKVRLPTIADGRAILELLDDSAPADHVSI
jgi:predicted dehydrogenase